MPRIPVRFRIRATCTPGIPIGRKTKLSRRYGGAVRFAGGILADDIGQSEIQQFYSAIG